jgi:ribonuclease J
MTKVQIIPLGGLGEIGKNMTVIRYDDEIYIIDSGVAFASDDMLGVDSVIPDFDYLRKNKHLLKKIFITHAHEDHIGSLSHFLKEFDVPIYTTKLTEAIIKTKLKNQKQNINIVDEHSRIKGENCTISFFSTNHSIPDSVGVVIETPIGNIVHTGDFKIDYTPIDKKYIDFQRLGEIGGQGVLALLSDSTNAEKAGVSLSEESVKGSLEDAVRKCDGRVIVATFASSLHRVPSLYQIAKTLGRKVVVLGRSMENNVKAATKLGYIDIPLELQITEKEMKDYRPEELMVITTGAQGESMAGLARMANGSHKNVTLSEGDSVIFSSSVVPGNEKTVGKLINLLLKKGVNVVTGKDIHTSGHGNQEEQKLMLSILKPKYFMPIHGEYRMLLKHSQLAESVGVEREDIFICENGSVLEITEEKACISGKVKADDILIDKSGMGDVDISVMRDRKRLSTHGIAVVQANCFSESNKRAKINVIFKGIVAKYDKNVMNRELSELITNKMKETSNIGKLKRDLYEEIGNIIYSHVKRKPMIVFLINNMEK